jgi:hypothetical protein
VKKNFDGGVPWNSREFHGSLWSQVKNSKKSLEFHGMPWNDLFTNSALKDQSMILLSRCVVTNA